MDIGFIGLGTMGSRMAARLIGGGHRLWAYDVAPSALARATELGATVCGSPREAASGRDVVLLSLPGPAAVQETVLGEDGVLAGCPPPALLIDTTSSLPQVARRIAALAAEKGCEVLDAPVSGGPEGAEGGTLSIMVGGSREVFERALPVLQLLGKSIHWVGEAGAGHTVKLVNNILGGVHMAAISEALMLGTVAGVDPRVLLDVVSVSTGNSRTLQNRGPRLLERNFEPEFMLELMHKDLDLAAQLGQELGVPMPTLNLVKQMYQMAKTTGLGKMDTAALAILWERMTGVEIRERASGSLQ